MRRFYKAPDREGFTLIELSIVLVIIGLIVGGVLAGKSLIDAARVRAQIGQIEQLDTAAGVFANKFAAYPGDVNAAKSSAFGLRFRDQANPGYFDEDRRYRCNSSIDSGFAMDGTECAMFWADLFIAQLIPDNMIYRSVNQYEWYVPNNTTPGSYWPTAKIAGNYVHVLSSVQSSIVAPGNWFALAGFAGTTGGNGNLLINPAILPADAAAMDAKADDGMPYSGAIQGTSITTVGGTRQVLNTRSAGATECFLTTSGITNYNSAYDTPACALLFKIRSLPQ